MLRIIGGVIVGYVVMALLIFATFTGLYLAIGADRAFLPDSYLPSPTWITASIILGFLAAMVGGYVAFAIGRTATAPRALAGVALLIGLFSAYPALMPAENDPRPNVRTGEVSNMEAMMNARQPAWIALLNPVIAVAGILYGGRRR
jgi:hypothetical protein